MAADKKNAGSQEIGHNFKTTKYYIRDNQTTLIRALINVEVGR